MKIKGRKSNNLREKELKSWKENIKNEGKREFTT